MESSASSLSALGTLEQRSTKTEDDLPIDHTPMIKSVITYKISNQFQSKVIRNNISLLGVSNPFYSYPFNNFHPREYNLNWKHIYQKYILSMGTFSHDANNRRESHAPLFTGTSYVINNFTHLTNDFIHIF